MLNKTSDYTIFKKNLCNREIDPSNLKKITASIKMNNMLELKPIIVNEGMEIIDGQHRLEAARNLGLEIYYIVQEKSQDHDMILLNSAQKNWTIADYVHYYATRGKSAYKLVMDICRDLQQDTKLILMLMGVNPKKIGDKIKSGTLTIDNLEPRESVEEKLKFIENIIAFIKEKTLENPSYLNALSFKRALCHMITNPDFSRDIFTAKLKAWVIKVKPCTSIISYVQMLSDIYNYRSSDKIDFVGFADKER